VRQWSGFLSLRAVAEGVKVWHLVVEGVVHEAHEPVERQLLGEVGGEAVPVSE
jgi:hypothetical protein